MHRKWLTGLTIVGVAGTGGVAYASVSGASDSTGANDTVATAPATTATAPASTAPATSTSAPATTAPSTRRDVTYQVGDAGTVEIEVAGPTMSAREVEPADGWTVAAASDTGTHIDVQFTNGTRLVGFSADLVGSEIVVSVTNALVPGSPGTVTTEPVPVTVIEDDSATLPPPVTPATSGPGSTEVSNTEPPPASATTAPSGSGDDEFDDDDHGDEVEDHDSDDDDHDDDDHDSDDDHDDDDHDDGVEIGDDD